jgi:hypothetical protein
LQVRRRRRRKKVPLADRQPLVRPQAPNEVWSADFVFDRTAEGRVLKCLTIVDDATTEAVAVAPARALGGLPVTRVLKIPLRMTVCTRSTSAVPIVSPRIAAAALFMKPTPPLLRATAIQQLFDPHEPTDVDIAGRLAILG